MPFIIAALGALLAAAFWWYRLREAGRAANEFMDFVQRLIGAHKRKQLRTKAESASLGAFTDPAAAATAMLIALAAPSGALDTPAEEAVKGEMRRVMGLKDVDETFTFGRWLAGEVSGPDDVSLKFAKLWMSALSTSERFDLYGMASRVACANGEPDEARRQALARLKRRLGLTRH